MRYVYLDQNYIIDHLGPGKDPQERENLAQLVAAQEVKVVVSAWNIYEFTKAQDDVERRQTVEALEGVTPCYFSDNGTLKQAELISFLSQRTEIPYSVRARSPLVSSVAQMWASYGGPLPHINETLPSCVEALCVAERDGRGIRAEVDKAPELTRGARAAASAGQFGQSDPIFDIQWFVALLPERGRDNRFVTIQERGRLAQVALTHLSELYAACPMLWLEDQLYRFRLFESVRVDNNDSVDSQHVIGPLIHCDYFMTADRKIVRFWRAVQNDSRVKARLIKRIGETKLG